MYNMDREIGKYEKIIEDLHANLQGKKTSNLDVFLFFYL